MTKKLWHGWLLLCLPLLLYACSVSLLAQRSASILQNSPSVGNAVVVKCESGVASKIRSVAISQIGTRETGQNRGAVVKYQRAVGLPDGSMYCAAFFYWCGTQTLYNPFFKTGLASLQRQRLEKKSHAKTPRDSIRSSSFALIYWQFDNSAFGHVDGMTQYEGGGWATVVKPNSSDRDPRNGGGVWKGRRNLNHPLARMKLKRIIYLV